MGWHPEARVSAMRGLPPELTCKGQHLIWQTVSAEVKFSSQAMTAFDPEAVTPARREQDAVLPRQNPFLPDL